MFFHHFAVGVWGDEGGNKLHDSFYGKNSSFKLGLTLLHSEWPKLNRVLALLSAIRLRTIDFASKGGSKVFTLRVDSPIYNV